MVEHRFPYLARFLKATQVDQHPSKEVSSVLSGGLKGIPKENSRELINTRQKEKSLLHSEKHAYRGDKTDKTLTARLIQLPDYPGCAFCGCIVSVDGLCWGCHKSEINQRYPHLKPLAQFQQTIWNSASFYKGQAHWQNLAREYLEDHGEKITQNIVVIYARNLGYNVVGDFVCWVNR